MSVRSVDPPVAKTSTGRRVLTRPLAATTYLLRNAGKSIPLTAVIVLAVMLVAGIISMINSIPLSIRVIYNYSREFTGITPRGDAAKTQPILDEIKKKSPIPIERIIVCRTTATVVQSIVGKWPFYIAGLEQKDLQYYLDRQGSKSLEGRLPAAGKAEAVISRPVAQNLGLKLGSELLGPEKDDGFSPNSVKVVGIADTERWVMLTSIEYLQDFHFPPIDIGILCAPTPAEQSKLDLWAEKYFKGRPVAVLAYHQVEKDTNDMFATLYQILNVVIGTLVLVITTMMGMLMNIYQSQRLVEFGLLQALGYTKKQLLSRVVIETVFVVVFGWLLGLVAAYGLLNVAKRTLMDPKAFALNVLDPVAYAYSIPLPIAILIVAIATVVLRFRKFDPIGVVERRIV
jgi:ABC-type lipoprotein release transport system permease subunit